MPKIRNCHQNSPATAQHIHCSEAHHHFRVSWWQWSQQWDTLHISKHLGLHGSSQTNYNRNVFGCVFACVRCPIWEQGYSIANTAWFGGAKVYDVLQSLKHECGEDLKWVVVYPGDWHLLKNYQLSLMKSYFDAGLNLEAWERLFRVMMELFLATDTQVSPFIQDRVKDVFLNAKIGDSPH